MNNGLIYADSIVAHPHVVSDVVNDIIFFILSPIVHTTPRNLVTGKISVLVTDT